MYLSLFRRNSFSRRAFTLVELLVVISIIGILMAMVIPAVQAARESGRKTQCLNNIRNLGQGSLQHLSQQQSLPSGGWGWNWVGDPDRGYGMRQPGSWIYSILPYIEETALHDRGKEGTGNLTTISAAKKAALTQVAKTPIAILNCPSRRRADTYATPVTGFVNMDTPGVMARADYGANSGSSNGNSADVMTPIGPDVSWLDDSRVSMQNAFSQSTSTWNKAYNADGVVYFCSEIRAASVKDGMSKTLLLGERSVPFSLYETISQADNEGWASGNNIDNQRFASAAYPPFGDFEEYSGQNMRFGGPHTAVFGAAFCDGSVRLLQNDIEPTVYQAIGVRNDGQAVDLSTL
jgi:prepilin-type N-terminal cleavage/methylation domain-containing protein